MTLICKSDQVQPENDLIALNIWAKKIIGSYMCITQIKSEVMLTIGYHNDCAIYTPARPPAVSFRIG